MYNIKEGSHSSEELLKRDMTDFKKAIYLWRFLAFFLFTSATFFIFLPIIEKMQWVPLVKLIVERPDFVQASIIALLFSTALCSLMIGVQWIRIRQIVGIILVSLSVISIAWIALIPLLLLK